MRLAIFGTGGMGRELADIARRAGTTELVFVEDDGRGDLDGIQVLPPEALTQTDRIALAIGSPDERRKQSVRFTEQRLATVVARTAIVARSAYIGEGSMICEHAVLNNSVRVGSHFLCNSFSLVSHDCIIGDFVTLSPRVTCCGEVHIGDDVYVGAGATIRNGSPERPLRIGAGALIGMGAVVTKDVPPGAIVWGVPAKVQLRNTGKSEHLSGAHAARL